MAGQALSPAELAVPSRPEMDTVAETEPVTPPASAFRAEASSAPNVDVHSPSLVRSSLSRRSRKDENLGGFFGLPTEEVCVNNFNCALKQRILLQGQLYVFPHHLCFYCNIFGYTKKRVMTFKDITSIRKRKMHGLPNAIEIVCLGKAEVYASFINRKEAYKLVLDQWRDCSDYGRLFAQQSGEPGTSGSAHSADDALARSSEQSEHLDSASLSQDSPGQPKNASCSHADEQGTDAGSNCRAEADSMPSPLPPKGERKASSRLRPDPSSSEPQTDGENAGPDPPARASQDLGRGRKRRGSWPIEQGAVPELMEDMSLAAEGQWPCSVTDALQRFFSDKSTMFKDWHEKRGDQNVRLGNWGQPLGSAVGHVRELHFVQPMTGALKGLPMAPKQTNCHQTQRLRLFAGDHAMFETTQHMTGIPMAEHFKVESRWDITAVAGDASCCQVRTHVAVPFSRSSMWKGTIERTTRAAVKDSHQDFIDSAPELQPNMPAAQPAPHVRVPVKLGRHTKSGRLSDSLSGAALSARGMSSRLSRDLVRKQTGSRSLEGLPSQQERVTSDSVTADVGGLMQRVEPAFRKDFLRVLRAGLDAEEAVGTPGASPMTMRIGSVGTPMSRTHRESLGASGRLTAEVAGQVWQLQLPSVAYVLAAVALIVFLGLQAAIFLRLLAQSSHSLAPGADSSSSALAAQIVQLQNEVQELKRQLANFPSAV